MRLSFLLKMTVIIGLIIAFDRLFPDNFAGACVGAFGLAWLTGLLIARRDVRHDRLAWIAAGCSALFALSLFDDPGPLAWTLFWCALSMAALLPRGVGFDDAYCWGTRLLIHGASGLVAPIRDIRQLWTRRRENARWSSRSVVATLALPLIGSTFFVTLFASANPIIASTLARIELPSPLRIIVWTFVAICVWPSLRPHPAVMGLASRLPTPEMRLPGTSLPSVLIALALFNAVFAVQNVLDIAFLWSGASLPDGMTMTEYVHRGAYPLVATALIAGALALAMLRPGSASAASPTARRLVTLWVGQNLVLVASSALRTIDYIESSMLTAWRIAALLWMALVALGLVLICARILKGLSARWLININAAAAGIVLAVCSFVDLGAIAADWNVRAPRPETIDLCYLNDVGDGALLPLIALERRAVDPGTLDRVRAVRQGIFDNLARRQARWTEWTPRGARRLAHARALLGPTPAQPMSLTADQWRGCDGAIQSAQPVES